MVIFHFKKSAHTQLVRKFCSCFSYHSPSDSEFSSLLSLPLKSFEIHQHFGHERSLSLLKPSVSCNHTCYKGSCYADQQCSCKLQAPAASFKRALSVAAIHLKGESIATQSWQEEKFLNKCISNKNSKNKTQLIRACSNYFISTETQ